MPTPGIGLYPGNGHCFGLQQKHLTEPSTYQDLACQMQAQTKGISSSSIPCGWAIATDMEGYPHRSGYMFQDWQPNLQLAPLDANNDLYPFGRSGEGIELRSAGQPRPPRPPFANPSVHLGAHNGSFALPTSNEFHYSNPARLPMQPAEGVVLHSFHPYNTYAAPIREAGRVPRMQNPQMSRNDHNEDHLIGPRRQHVATRSAPPHSKPAPDPTSRPLHRGELVLPVGTSTSPSESLMSSSTSSGEKKGWKCYSCIFHAKGVSESSSKQDYN